MVYQSAHITIWQHHERLDLVTHFFKKAENKLE